MLTMNKIIFLCSFCLLSGCGTYDYVKEKLNEEDQPEIKEFATPEKCADNLSRTERMVSYLNQVRARAQVCGDKSYAATQALTLNEKLLATAKAHSNDMASNNFLSHLGSDDSNISMRIDNKNYAWSAVGENIAGGPDTPEQAIEDWMASPDHCRNIMNPIYTEFGMACAVNQVSEYGIYWTLVLAHSK